MCVLWRGVRGEESDWGSSGVMFRSPRPPLQGTCSLTPLGEAGQDLVAFQTYFRVTCDGWRDADDGDLRYRVYHSTSDDPVVPFHLAYRGYDQSSDDFQLPPGRRWVTVRIENEFTYTNVPVAELDLKAPFTLEAKEVDREVERMLALGEPYTAVIRAGQAALVLQHLPAEAQVVDGMKEALLKQLLQLTTIYPEYELEEILVQVETLVGEGGAPAGPGPQQEALHLLPILVHNFVKRAKEQHMPELRVNAVVEQVLRVWGRLLELQHEDPRPAPGQHHVQHLLQEVLTRLEDLLVATRQTSAGLLLAPTPEVTLGAFKTVPEVGGGGGRRLVVGRVLVVLPHTPPPNTLTTILATSLNPVEYLAEHFASDFLRLATAGPQDQVSLRFHRTAPVPPAVLLPIQGTMSCVRSQQESCGWQISADASPTVTLQLPPHITSFVQVSLPFENIKVNDKGVGAGVEPPLLLTMVIAGEKNCLPLRDALQTKDFNITATTIGSEPAFMVKNSRDHDVKLSMRFMLDRKGSKLGQSLSMDCSGCGTAQSVPLSLGIRVSHISEQCVRHDPAAAGRYNTTTCVTAPGDGHISCECVGPGLYTVMSSP